MGKNRAPSQLRRELLPAFGGPTIARWIPDRMISPLLPSSRYFCIRALKATTFSRAVPVPGTNARQQKTLPCRAASGCLPCS